MPEEYFSLPNDLEAVEAGALSIPRAQALVSALQSQRDYTIVQILKRQKPSYEYIVVDTANDRVPPKNPHGIRYKERLLICIPRDATQLIEIRALRKDFPVFLHQNQTRPGEPPSLCLYFEPPAAVSRTWTAQSFLRRIQWWLEKAARGELHAADQPVENLFFVTKYELVLPWNYGEVSKDPEQKLHIVGRVQRPDEGRTFFMEPQKQGTPGVKAACIEIILPPILHGIIESDPGTLGDLDDLLRSRGADFSTALKTTLAGRVGPAGAAISSDDPCTIVLLHVPIRREETSNPERISHRAFLLLDGPLKLGADAGALFLLDQTYFNAQGVLNAAAAVTWRAQPLLPMEVLHENTATLARQQSGTTDDGPTGVLIGVGSLGSAMLNLWGRGGWGRWTVIDKDHIKPHNLSRHTAYGRHIGRLKTEIVAGLHHAAMRDGAVTPVFGDACDLANAAISGPIKAAALVIDASTTLEYPRLASTRDDLARHISVFVTPSGNAAVLLAEDDKRARRLRTLEAQYYRALIQSDWGQRHLDGNLGTYWSGASCRDISAVMPYSRIMAHASTLAEQIPLAARQPNALIRIWERHAENGGIIVHDVDVHSEQSMAFRNLILHIDAGVEDQLRAMRATHLPNETGGVLLGYYDFNVDAVVVVCGLPAPPDSKSTPESFERGIAGLAEAVEEASRRTAGIVHYVGEWHSHPPGHSAAQSGHDLIQLCRLASGMADEGLPALQLIVGEHDLQIFQGIVRS